MYRSKRLHSCVSALFLYSSHSCENIAHLRGTAIPSVTSFVRASKSAERSGRRRRASISRSCLKGRGNSIMLLLRISPRCLLPLVHHSPCLRLPSLRILSTSFSWLGSWGCRIGRGPRRSRKRCRRRRPSRQPILYDGGERPSRPHRARTQGHHWDPLQYQEEQVGSPPNRPICALTRYSPKCKRVVITSSVAAVLSAHSRKAPVQYVVARESTRDED